VFVLLAFALLFFVGNVKSFLRCMVASCDVDCLCCVGLVVFLSVGLRSVYFCLCLTGSGLLLAVLFVCVVVGAIVKW